MELATESGIDLSSFITQLGVGGIFAFLIIRQVLDFLAKKKSNGNTSVVSPNVQSELFMLLRDIQSKVTELERLHDVKDEDGVPVWYLRRSLERQLNELISKLSGLADAVRSQTEVLKRMEGNT